MSKEMNCCIGRVQRERRIGRILQSELTKMSVPEYFDYIVGRSNGGLCAFVGLLFYFSSTGAYMTKLFVKEKLTGAAAEVSVVLRFQVVDEMKRRSGTTEQSDEQAWKDFVTSCQHNIHVILRCHHTDDGAKAIAWQVPGVLKSCTIDNMEVRSRKIEIPKITNHMTLGCCTAACLRLWPDAPTWVAKDKT
jgi:hypothetical protein